MVDGGVQREVAVSMPHAVSKEGEEQREEQQEDHRPDNKADLQLSQEELVSGRGGHRQPVEEGGEDTPSKEEGSCAKTILIEDRYGCNARGIV